MIAKEGEKLGEKATRKIMYGYRYESDPSGMNGKILV